MCNEYHVCIDSNIPGVLSESTISNFRPSKFTSSSAVAPNSTPAISATRFTDISSAVSIRISFLGHKIVGLSLIDEMPQCSTKSNITHHVSLLWLRKRFQQQLTFLVRCTLGTFRDAVSLLKTEERKLVDWIPICIYFLF